MIRSQDWLCQFACRAWVSLWGVSLRLLALTLWEGDKIFLRLLDTRRDFFELTLRYRGEALVGASLDGVELIL